VNNQETINSIKFTVHTFLPEAQVLLFGSRAKGQNTERSDYDLLIITQRTYEPRENMHWESKISKALIASLRAPFDVIVQSNEDIALKGNSKGSILYYALKDAVEL